MKTSTLLGALGALMLTIGAGAAPGIVGLRATGTSAGGGRAGTAEDMLALDLSNAVPGVHHIGLTAPDPGRIEHLQWTTQVAGAGVLGTNAVFEVVREADNTVLCAATVPCDQVVGDHVLVECSADLDKGEHLDVRPAAPSACLLAPKGVLVVTFFWQ